jgi:hypothetical protein
VKGKSTAGHFQVSTPDIEAHAGRTEQRADEVSGHAQGIGSASLGSSSLGSLGANAGTRANSTIQHASTAVSGMSSQMTDVAARERRSARAYQDADGNQANVFNKLGTSTKSAAKSKGAKNKPYAGETSTAGASGSVSSSHDANASYKLNGGKPLTIGEPGNTLPITVSLDDHQQKHQSNIPGLPPYGGGKGEPFPAQITAQSHETYFGPVAAGRLKQQLDADSQRLNELKTESENAAYEQEEAQRVGKNAAQDLRQFRKGTPEYDAAYSKVQELGADYQQKKAATAAAQQAVDDEDARIKNSKYVLDKKDSDSDNVKYDASMTYDDSSGMWHVGYHNNPATTSNEAASDKWPGQSWWNNYGKSIDFNNPQASI